MLKKLRLLWRRSQFPKITEGEIVAALYGVGIRPGDLLQVHSSLSSLGYVVGGASAVVDSLIEAVSPGGTVLVPTFNHGAEEIFDLYTSPSQNGTITETFRLRPAAVRSLHPTHPYAAIGPMAKVLCEGHLEATTFGMDSPLGRLAQKAGWVLLLGVGMNRCTAAHLGEWKARVPCIGWDQQPRWVRDPRTGEILSVKGDVWRDGPCHIEWDPIEQLMRERGLIQDGRIGKCPIMRMRAMDVINTSYELTQTVCAICATRPYPVQ